MAHSTGAEKLLKGAVDQGISVCFANPGTSEMHFVSAMDTVWGLRAILGLHETVCSGAADGYGRMARKPALTLLHLGPGLGNALANLHNARRAGTPIVNLIGDMATWHKAADPLLNMNIPEIADTVSKTVLECRPVDDLYVRMKQACTATERPDAVSGSRIATLIVPHDMSWHRSATPTPSTSIKSGISMHGNGNGNGSLNSGVGGKHHPQSSPPSSYSTVSAIAGAPIAMHASLPQAAQQFLKECGDALKRCPRGKAAFYIGGRAGLMDQDALLNIGRIVSATGAALYSENAFSRLDRGVGTPAMQRLPYFPNEAISTLRQYQVLVLVDVRRPVANFGYEGGPSELIELNEDSVWEIDATSVEVAAAVAYLSEQVGGSSIKPFVNCRGAFCSLSRPSLPTGRLTAAAMCQVVAALQPEGAILVDESLTSGTAYWDLSRGCPSFSHLSLTGGAIGFGPPVSVGAAIACPTRTVINLQADGSGMYSVQALWTQAKEKLKVVTVVCANRTYAILKVEMAKQRITPSNGRAAKALTDLEEPAIDWVSIATGFGVPASRARSAEELASQFTAALDSEGPYLIEAVL